MVAGMRNPALKVVKSVYLRISLHHVSSNPPLSFSVVQLSFVVIDSSGNIPTVRILSEFLG